MKDLKQRIEEIGVVMEGLRSTPVEARVFALLLLSDPPYRSFDEIREILEASKSAVSNALSRMQQHGAVSYITFPGDRKRYFRLDMGKMQKKLIDAAKAMEAFNGILQQALIYREDNEDPQSNQELKKLLDFQIYLSESLQQAVAKWQCQED